MRHGSSRCARSRNRSDIRPPPSVPLRTGRILVSGPVRCGAGLGRPCPPAGALVSGPRVALIM